MVWWLLGDSIPRSIYIRKRGEFQEGICVHASSTGEVATSTPRRLFNIEERHIGYVVTMLVLVVALWGCGEHRAQTERQSHG